MSTSLCMLVLLLTITCQKVEVSVAFAQMRKLRPTRLSDLSRVMRPFRGRAGVQTGQSDSKARCLVTQL